MAINTARVQKVHGFPINYGNGAHERRSDGEGIDEQSVAATANATPS